MVTEKAETNMVGSKCAERSVLVLCTPKSLFIKPEQKQHKAVLFRLMSDSGKTMREREKKERHTLKSSISVGETGGLSVREPLRGPLL